MMTTVGGAVTTKGGGPGTPVLTPTFTSLAAAIPVPIPIAATAATNQTFGAMASSRAPGKVHGECQTQRQGRRRVGRFPTTGNVPRWHVGRKAVISGKARNHSPTAKVRPAIPFGSGAA